MENSKLKQLNSLRITLFTMLKRCKVIGLVIMLCFSTMVAAIAEPEQYTVRGTVVTNDFVSYAEEATLTSNSKAISSASTKITIFTQHASQSSSHYAIASQYLGKNATESSGSTTMYQAGCGIYSLLHIIQWCTNNGNGMELTIEQGVALTKELIKAQPEPYNYMPAYDDKCNAVANKHGVKQVSAPDMNNTSALKSHFDKGGAVFLHEPNWGKTTGHYIAAVGYTEYDVDGNGTKDFLIHIVDSAVNSSASRFTYKGYKAYRMNTYSSLGSGWSGGGEYLIPHNVYKSLDRHVGYLPNGSSYGVMDYISIDSTYRIGVSKKERTDVAGDDQCYINKTPYEDGTTTVMIAEKGTVINISGAVKNSYGNIWYRTANGFVYSGDVTVYEYIPLFDISGKFTATQKGNSHVAPYTAAPTSTNINQNQKLTTKRFVTNSYGNIWAELADGSYVCFHDTTKNETYLLFDSHVTQPIENTTRPSGNIPITSSQGFWLKGSIEARVPFLTVSTRIIDQDTGEDVTETGSPVTVSPAPTVQKLELWVKNDSTCLDSKTKFKQLAGKNGSYIYQLNVQFGFTHAGKTFKFGEETNLVTSNFTVGSGSTTPKYTLDVGARINGSTLSTLSGLGTFDMYINGSLVANDVTDYNKSHIAGTTYQVKDITTNSSYEYVDVYSGSLSGTMGSADKTIVLEFATATYVNIPSTYSVEMGHMVQIPGADSASAATTWSTNDSSILKVRDDGYVCGVMPGTAVATVYSSSGSEIASCTVTVVPPSSYTLDLEAGGQFSGTISGVQRMHVFKFIPKYTGYYEFESRYDVPDTYGYVFNEQWQCLAYDDDSAGDGHFRIRYHFYAGDTYYLTARMYNAFTDDVLTTGIDFAENISFLPLDTTCYADITHPGGSVYFEFTPTVSGKYTISSVGNDDTWGDLYHCTNAEFLSWNPVASDDDGGEGNNFDITCDLLAGQTYILDVSYFSNAQTGTVGVRAERFAPELALNAPQTADISVAGGYAFHVFTPDETGFYTFTSIGSNDTVGYLYNKSTWEQLSNNDDDGEGSNFKIVYYMNAGTEYAIGTRFWDSAKTGSFAIQAKKHILRELGLNEYYPITINGDGAFYNVSFTPTKSGRYVFRSIGTGDTVGKLYDSTMENMLVYDDDSGDQFNFLIQNELTAGTTYVLSSGYYSTTASGSYTIVIEEYVPVESVHVGYCELLPGETLQLDVYTQPENATIKGGWFAPIDNDVCTITEEGVVTAKASGIASTVVYSYDNWDIQGEAGVFVHEPLDMNIYGYTDKGKIHIWMINDGSDNEQVNNYSIYLDSDNLTIETCDAWDGTNDLAYIDDITFRANETDMGYCISVYRDDKQNNLPVNGQIHLVLNADNMDELYGETVKYAINYVWPVRLVPTGSYFTGYPYYQHVTAPSEIEITFPDTPYVPVESIFAGTYEMRPEETVQITPSVMPENADDKRLWFEPLDNDVCTITEEGYVTAKASGWATTTIYSNDNWDIRETVDVLVHEPVDIKIDAITDKDGLVYLTMTNSGSEKEYVNNYSLFLKSGIFHVESCTATDGDGKSMDDIKFYDGEVGEMHCITVCRSDSENNLPVNCEICLVLSVSNLSDVQGQCVNYQITNAWPVYTFAGNQNNGSAYTNDVTFPSEFEVSFPAKKNPMNDSTFVLPTLMDVIEQESFAGIAPSNIRLPDGVTSIESKAFANCANLKGIYIPASCTKIAADAFSGVSKQDMLIYCEPGSYAATYAAVTGYRYVLLKID